MSSCRICLADAGRTLLLMDEQVFLPMGDVWSIHDADTHAQQRERRPKFSSVQFSCSVVSDSLRPHELQHARPPCPSPTPGVYPNSCASSQWCQPTTSSSIIPFSSCLQSFPASGSFQMSQFFAWNGQSIGVSASASVLPMSIQDWFALGLTGWISLQSKGLSSIFCNTTVQKHQFFGQRAEESFCLNFSCLALKIGILFHTMKQVCF